MKKLEFKNKSNLSILTDIYDWNCQNPFSEIKSVKFNHRKKKEISGIIKYKAPFSKHK